MMSHYLCSFRGRVALQPLRPYARRPN